MKDAEQGLDGGTLPDSAAAINEDKLDCKRTAPTGAKGSSAEILAFWAVSQDVTATRPGAHSGF